MPPRDQLVPAADHGPPDLKHLFSELVRLETELWDAVANRLRADHDLPLPQFEFMGVIARTPNCRVQDIAAAISITVGGASKIVDRIEAAGHCARRANPTDRRSSIVALTPAGERLLAIATVTFEEELRVRLGSAIPDRSLVQLTNTLSRLRAAVRSAGPAEKSAWSLSQSPEG
jgi:MarR family transcriptional regulator, organic hydroperoxide resistance regulator